MAQHLMLQLSLYRVVAIFSGQNGLVVEAMEGVESYERWLKTRTDNAHSFPGYYTWTVHLHAIVIRHVFRSRQGKICECNIMKESTQKSVSVTS
jgi:hypothetical protein